MPAKLPTRRFSSAGATKEETAALQLEFERSDLGIQEAMIDYFKGLSIGGIREYLANWRELHAPEGAETAPEAPLGEAAPEVAEDTQTEPESPLPAKFPEDDEPTTPDEPDED